jgi:hypothetical protein
VRTSGNAAPEHAEACPQRASAYIEEVKVSKRGEYALRALIDLGIASELGHPLLPAQQIVARENLPKGFLDQILMQLRKAGKKAAIFWRSRWTASPSDRWFA